MKLSARNALKGKVTEVKLGQVVGEVVLDIGGQKVTSVITRDAIEEMGVKVGDEVSAVINLQRSCCLSLNRRKTWDTRLLRQTPKKPF